MREKFPKRWKKMMGNEGMPDILVRRELCKFFRCNWFELYEIPVYRWNQAIIVLEVEAELAEQRHKDAEMKAEARNDSITANKTAPWERARSSRLG